MCLKLLDKLAVQLGLSHGDFDNFPGLFCTFVPKRMSPRGKRKTESPRVSARPPYVMPTFGPGRAF
jgi:hypothetical protein